MSGKWDLFAMKQSPEETLIEAAVATALTEAATGNLNNAYSILSAAHPLLEGPLTRANVTRLPVPRRRHPRQAYSTAWHRTNDMADVVPLRPHRHT